MLGNEDVYDPLQLTAPHQISSLDPALKSNETLTLRDLIINSSQRVSVHCESVYGMTVVYYYPPPMVFLMVTTN